MLKVLWHQFDTQDLPWDEYLPLVPEYLELYQDFYEMSGLTKNLDRGYFICIRDEDQIKQIEIGGSKELSKLIYIDISKILSIIRDNKIDICIS